MSKEETKNPRINLYGNTSQVMNDAIDRVVVEIHNKGRKIEGAHKLLLTGCGPQCGSTFVSIGLGISFAAAKWKTLIIDCDLRRKSDYKKLNDNTEKGLSDFLLKESRVEETQFDEIVYPTNFDNLYYIPCGNCNVSPARLLCSSVMQELIQLVNEKYDYVIFDFPSVSVAPDAQILFGEVNGIILISALDAVTKKQIKDAKHKVQPFADRYYGMIINKIDMSLYRKALKRYDYYFVDRKGNQKLGEYVPKKYRRRVRTKAKVTVKEEADNE